MYKYEIVLSYSRETATISNSSLVFQKKQKKWPPVMEVNMLGKNEYWLAMNTQTPKQQILKYIELCYYNCDIYIL